MIASDIHAAVVRDDDALAVGRVHPDIVGIAAAPVLRVETLAAIGRQPKAAIGHQHFVGILRVDGDVDVISCAPDQCPLPTAVRPRFAAIVGAPDGSLIGRLNQRVHALGIIGRDGHVDLPHRRLGHAVPFDARPRPAAIVCHINSAAWTVLREFAIGSAAEHRVGVHHYAPRSSEKRVRIAGIHRETRAASVRIDEQ